MFPCNNNIINNNPFEYTSTDDHHQISENPSPCNFLNFPNSHLLDDDDFLLSHFLHHHHQEDHQHIPPPSSPPPPQQYSPPQPPPPPVPDIVPADNGISHHEADPSGSKNNKAAASEPPKKSTSSARKSAGGGKKPVVEGTTPKRRRTTTAATTTTKGPKPAGSSAPRRRTGKKDRHSKIYTAHGPRDRRMRLSLQIARKFFDLQDMLGFDKASKTIEWLFNKSKSAIKEITATTMVEKKKMMSCGGGGGGGGGASTSSTTTTDCIVSMGTMQQELESPADHNQQHLNNYDEINVEDDQLEREKSSRSRKVGGNKLLGSSSSTSCSPLPAAVANNNNNNNLAKKKREKARERARKRTNEKLRLKNEIEKSSTLINPNSSANNLEKFGSSSNSTPEIAGGEELSAGGCPSGSSIMEAVEKCNSAADNTNQQHYSLENQMASVGIMEKLLLGTTSTSSSSSRPVTAASLPYDSFNYDSIHHHHHPNFQQQLQDGLVSNTAAGGLRPWPYINNNNDSSFLDHFPGNWVESAGSAGYGEMTSLMMMSNNHDHHNNIGHDVCQDQNPSTSTDYPLFTGTSSSAGMFLQSQYQDSHFSCNSLDNSSNHTLF